MKRNNRSSSLKNKNLFPLDTLKHTYHLTYDHLINKSPVLPALQPATHIATVTVKTQSQTNNCLRIREIPSDEDKTIRKHRRKAQPRRHPSFVPSPGSILINYFR